MTARLAALGVQPADLTHIVATHFHFDHGGGLPEFPGVPIVAQRAAVEAARNRPAARAGEVDAPGLVWQLVEGDVELVPRRAPPADRGPRRRPSGGPRRDRLRWRFPPGDRHDLQPRPARRRRLGGLHRQGRGTGQRPPACRRSPPRAARRSSTATMPRSGPSCGTRRSGMGWTDGAIGRRGGQRPGLESPVRATAVATKPASAGWGDARQSPHG